MNPLFDGAKQLQNHPTVSSGLGPGGLLFGLPFLGAGVVMVLIAYKVIPSDPASVHAPMWVLGLVGLVFAIPGAAIMIAGARGGLAQRRRRAALARYPDEPWRADRAWDERVARDRASDPLGYFAAAAFVTLFLSVFNYLAFATQDVPVLIKGLVGLFDLALATLWACAFYVLGRRLKYGSTKVRLATFPFLVGHTLKSRSSYRRR